MTGVYFSADSDEYTVAKRTAGILTGEAIDAIERDMGKYAESLSMLDHVRFEYRTLDIEGIADRLASFEQVYGAYPDFVFVDNLMNYCDSAGEWELMRTMTRELDSLARETKSHIATLHHCSESYPSGQPLPMASIQGKVTQIPRLVLTIAAVECQLMVVAAKNTNGPMHPRADKWMRFEVEESMRIIDLDWRQA